jgi:hypothetical protein
MRCFHNESIKTVFAFEDPGSARELPTRGPEQYWRVIFRVVGMSAQKGHVTINADESVVASSAQQAAEIVAWPLKDGGHYGVEIDTAEYTRLYNLYWGEFHASKSGAEAMTPAATRAIFQL